MERKLRKCNVCGEWFVTTDAIMMKHYAQCHPQWFREAMEAAAQVVRECIELAKATYQPRDYWDSLPLTITRVQ